MQGNGLSSLVNLGNTCYINSTLQCLIHTKKLNNFFDNIFKTLTKKKTNEFQLIKEYDDIRKKMWSQNCTIAPKRFINFIQQLALLKDREEFGYHYQCCASDFTQFLIECLHNGIKREVNINIDGIINNEQDSIAIKCYKSQKLFQEKDYSELIPIFSAIQVTSILNLNDNNSEPNYVCEPYMSLSLPIPSKNKGEQLTLTDCFKEYTKDEVVILDNIEKSKKIIFWSLPEVLIITLSRFHNDAKRKITSVINSDLSNINLSEFIIGYNKDSFIYDIYATCEHSGNQQGGHYTSNVKVNEKWYNINDNVITEIIENKVINGKTYILFLEKKRC